MQINFSELSYDAKWFDFGDARLKIRPYPSSLVNVAIKDGNPLVQGQEQWDTFNYCLVGWENVTDADGKAIPCTEEIKQKVFDFSLAAIPVFVLFKSRQFEAAKETAEKNS